MLIENRQKEIDSEREREIGKERNGDRFMILNEPQNVVRIQIKCLIL